MLCANFPGRYEPLRVSNMGMRQTILHFSFLILTFCSWVSGQSANEKTAAVQRVKALLVSSLDRSLPPKVTLEFFLEYEGEGGSIKWEVNDCGEQTREAEVAHRRGSGMCVEADIAALKDGRTATVLVALGTFKRGSVDVPIVCGVTVTYPGGTTQRFDRLSDLPVELHRPLPKGPQDIPAPGGALDRIQ
jgi:hypothetical protein